MARYVMVLRSATSLLGALEGVDLENFQYKCQKNNWYIGSFMYPSAVVYCCVLLLCVVVCCCVLLCVAVCCCVLEGWGCLLVAVLCEQVFGWWGLVGRAPPPTIV